MASSMLSGYLQPLREQLKAEKLREIFKYLLDLQMAININEYSIDN